MSSKEMIVFLARGILVSLFILEYKKNVSLGIKPQLVYDGCPVYAVILSVIRFMETEEQLKDRERLKRYIVRESLISVMNNIKWEKLRTLMLEETDKKPAWRVRCLRDKRDVDPQWDGDWYYHLPEYKYIEWLEIYPINKEHRGHVLSDKITDNTKYFITLLKSNNIPFSIEEESLRVWGYQRPGQTVEFV